jgi:hypothetical protein
MEMPSAIAVARFHSVVDGSAVFWQKIAGGFTAAEHWRVTFADGSTCFVKIAVGRQTSAWLRAEYLVYSQLEADFMPRLIAWSDQGGPPILVLEDLSDGYWPPPWQDGQVDAVLHMLSHVRATRLPLPRIASDSSDEGSGAWEQVAKDPLPFLSVGVCSSDWLNESMPALLAASKAAPVEGEELVHMDVRSDNICFVHNRGVLVDWNWAARGNGLLDIAFWAPSLEAEGGPAPEELLPNAAAWAAFVSGYIAARAGVTPLRDAVRVREVNLKQLRTSLAWAVRALDLPPLDGRLTD